MTLRYSRTLRVCITGLAVALGAASLTACNANSSQKSGDAGGGNTIALLLPESKTTRYEAFDKPLFEKKVAELCSSCKVSYYNADQDEAKQSQQVETAITAGAKAIVLGPVNGDGAGGMVASAKNAKIPVIAYDRFIAGADYYLSFDNEQVGRIQGKSLVDALGGRGNILMLNGAPSDPNAAQFKAGARSVIGQSGIRVIGEYDNPDWSPDKAQQFVTDQLSRNKPSDIQGVYAANDGQAGGVVAALTGAGVSADALPPITGQDAELAAVQRIVAGRQSMTVYKPIAIEANTAAEVAVALATGKDVPTTTASGIQRSTFKDVSSYIFTPIAVTKANVASTVVADKFYTADQICTPEYKDACAKAGIN
ncbi:Solute-binding protein OS=Tsukamurella paurometabola (strain ATCC 8368 / DSM / CCUG 35730 /CIP 100753 / JCM 10117 / KCTC 9821 / NBRC 16120 / NCIMB 702349/ NCTC 13040) OX=521096 GN=Tpau_4212 PE=4 SV=1 [Tsukamurella paurometabola]|uniref:Solute-binding protein n=1 Tax=Tsukamurella paurometabola (strain ATCC 8368 / DSM 20162 / CCUG 35730 / CIP 100753 / JCM 10117 / KCTC 9821 / NBRC 16120 / NCIMB 702349 / NCTC 13040) TaxID=521096 RepID=D5UP71_TSUPD|nr:substrate-binding domain-containing protein [Tsukamurella paurometabola]ADG80780.1 solute-binding protein [Tsukamurella paurometabola DSM 20162]SUP40954.1 D-xylose-binding periplasmic protein precursor [Tsukamurella paurometabola]